MKNIAYGIGCVIILGVFLAFCVAYLFLGTDLYRQGLTIAEVNDEALNCHRAGLQSYVTAKNDDGDPISISCRGFD